MTRICVPVCFRRIEEMRQAVARASRVGDVIELRLDCLDEVDDAPELLIELTKAAAGSVILTLRSLDQGGHTSTSYDRRLRFWLSFKNIPPDAFCDLELDLVREFSVTRAREYVTIPWNQVICSHHDFSAVPKDVERIYGRLAETPAAIIKIAAQANDATDCIPIFRLLERAQREGRELIAIAMGQPGIMTRVLGPSRGSFLTYGSLDEESQTAPGQLTARELRERYRIDRIDRHTNVFGIVGNPVSHSLSPGIQNAAFTVSEANAVYIPIEVHDVTQFLRRMVHPRSRELDLNLRGLSVTAPHKSSVMSCLDWIEPAAKEIGAVNTIVVQDDQLLGYNTDAAGFIATLRQTLGSLENNRCAILGAGGAARACLWALRQEGAGVTVLARDQNKARALAQEFNVQFDQLTNAELSGFDVVVNATPLGTRGKLQNETPATAEELRGVRLAYDLVYNPIETRFIRAARYAGCQTLSGIEMFLAQAVEQFELWTGREPDADAMRTAAFTSLSQ